MFREIFWNQNCCSVELAARNWRWYQKGSKNAKYVVLLLEITLIFNIVNIISNFAKIFFFVYITSAVETYRLPARTSTFFVLIGPLLLKFLKMWNEFEFESNKIIVRLFEKNTSWILGLDLGKSGCTTIMHCLALTWSSEQAHYAFWSLLKLKSPFF